MDSKTARIRALNDELRQNFAQGMAVMTPVAQLWRVRCGWPSGLFQDRLLRRDPHVHSPDPADPSVTKPRQRSARRAKVVEHRDGFDDAGDGFGAEGG